MGVKIDLKPGSDRAFYNHVDEKVITLPNGIIIGTPILDVLPCDNNDCKIDTNIIPHKHAYFNSFSAKKSTKFNIIIKELRQKYCPYLPYYILL